MPPFADYTDSIRFGYRIDTIVDPVFHSHPRYEVYYFHEGSCNYLIGDKIYSLSPGDLILMNGMTLHCAKIDPISPYIRSIVHYDPAGLKPFLDPQHAVNILKPFQELGNYRISLRGREKEEAERMLQYMHSLYMRHDQIGYNRFLLAFVDFLYFIYERCQTPLKDLVDHPTEKEKTVQRIISFIERNYAEDLHLVQLQEHLHLSKFYMPKIFKKITGVTIFEFLYQRRINQAKIQFILDPHLSVTEVGFLVGFKHLAHFSRIFKQQVGLSPEQYKKSVRAAVT
jgi:AraC-like DNA-binding protein